MLHYQLYPLGDQAIVVEFGDEISLEFYSGVQQLSKLLESKKPEWLVEYVPAYTTVTLFYNPFLAMNDNRSSIMPYEVIANEIDQLLSRSSVNEPKKSRTVEIPVCYGGELGPDLGHVASYNHMTEDEVVEIHTSGDYIVYMLGFAPGFPYIGGMSDRIATPRRASPRVEIPARSVGIAGGQTGVYPIETPGGWQLIGRTPLSLFQLNKKPPTLLQAGDRVCFKKISYEEFRHLEEEQHAYHS